VQGQWLIMLTKGGTSVKTTGKRKSKISDTAELLEYAKDYDPDYYIENQILPSVLKILGELGVSKDELLGKGKQSSLDHFF